jgi:hypothetical protein
MSQRAAFYILSTKNLDTLKHQDFPKSGIKKSWFGLKRKTQHPFIMKLEELAVEKISYRWSALAFPILAVFSRESLRADWSDLEYSTVADRLSEKIAAGIYIFSQNDLGLMKIKPNGYLNSIQQLDQFAAEFAGSRPKNPDVMRNAAKALEEALSKLTKDTVLLLLLTSDES